MGRMTVVARAVLPAVVLAVSLLPAAGAAAPSPSSSNGGVTFAAIGVRTMLPADTLRVAAFARGRGYAVRAVGAGLAALEVSPPAGEWRRALRDLTLYPGVLYAEPVYRVRAADTPTDALYPRQKAYLEAVHAPEAWDIETGDESVVVAVLDTGIDASHPDLAGRLWTNAGETAGNGVDDDGNGCVDDVRGCSFVGDGDSGCVGALADSNVADDVGHGTFVAGIIAANANGTGIVGVARGVRVMAVKILDCTGAGDTLALTQGIIYAAQQGARVINISLGGPDDSAFVREAVRFATERGSLIIAATGNTGASGVLYPARLDDVLAVGAASAADPDARATFSTTGPEVDVVAVGEGVVGSVPKASCGELFECIGGAPYAEASGTSFAAPQVSGLAALVLSRRPSMAPSALLELIRATATRLAGGEGWAGAGRIDMLRALAPQFRLGAAGVTRN